MTVTIESAVTQTKLLLKLSFWTSLSLLKFKNMLKLEALARDYLRTG